MSDDDVHVKGLAELGRFLDALPVKIEKNIMRSALRAGATVLAKAARESVHKVSGATAKSIKVGTKVKGGRVIAYVKAKHFTARFLEWGTRPHFIAARSAKALSVGGVFRTGVEHHGARPFPFMRPALDTRIVEAVVAVGEKIKQRLTKEGLDVADVKVEGDE